MTVPLQSKYRQTIRKFIPLTTLSESAFNKLYSQIRIEEGAKGTILFKQGDQKNEFVYLLEGAISLQAAGMEIDTIHGGSEEARFALAHQIPRKVFAVAKDKIRFIRMDAEVLNSTALKPSASISYEVSDIPEEVSGDWMTTLLKSPIFQRLPAANLQKVLTSLEEIHVAAGESVLKQGDRGDYYYIIKQGRCSLTRKPYKNAKEIKLAELKTTDTFGEDSLISGAPRNVDITMLTDGILLRLSKENFLEFVKGPVIQTVTIDQATSEFEKGGVLLDVRVPDDYERAHIKGSRNVPFFSLRMQITSLDPAKRLIVICEDGNTSEAATFQLIRFGFDAVVLKGGINALSPQNLALLNSPPQQAISELQQQLDQARQSRAWLEKQKTELSESRSGEVESLFQEKQAFEKEAADLKHRVEQIVEERRRMESEAKRRIDLLQKNLTNFEQQLAEKNSALESTQTAQRNSENLIRALQEKIDELSPNTTAKTSLGKMIAACVISGIVSLAGAGGILLGTKNGREWLEFLVNADSRTQFLSRSDQSGTSRIEHPNKTPTD